MAEKDILEKVLLSHADVFADCVNTLAYEEKDGSQSRICSLRRRRVSIRGKRRRAASSATRASIGWGMARCGPSTLSRMRRA